ncbi:MAG: alanine racemase [Frankiaceae bacterium]|nr:alanine racemase [Frankiaceae bacterium]
MALTVRAEAVVDLAAIRSSVAALVAHCDGSAVMSVVKADGYGHGAVPSARAAIAGGATWLGVALVEEAVALREAGVGVPVLVLVEPPPGAADLAARYAVDLAVGSRSALQETVAAAGRSGSPVRVHLKVDTGLTRGGATAADWPALVSAAGVAQAAGAVEVVAVWSHLACADDPGHPSIDRQLQAFRRAAEIAAPLRPTLLHLANSAAAVSRPDTHFDLVRPGIACYGLAPIPRRPDHLGLIPAMSLHARVALTKRVPAGTGVSYGHRYVTPAETTVALVPLGYADGVPRAAGSTAEVWVGGRRRRISGTVSMDQFVVDVGDDDVTAGAAVVLFGSGSGGEPTAQDWADALGTISYEITTRIGPRVPRRYVGGTP